MKGKRVGAWSRGGWMGQPPTPAQLQAMAARAAAEAAAKAAARGAGDAMYAQAKEAAKVDPTITEGAAVDMARAAADTAYVRTLETGLSRLTAAGGDGVKTLLLVAGIGAGVYFLMRRG